MKQPRNTTETKEITFKTEETLRISETKFKTVFEHSLDGILVADAKNRNFILANPAMQTITGYTPEELTKLKVDDMHPKKDLASMLTQFNQQARGKTCLAKNIPVLCKDRSLIYCDINIGIMKLNGRNYVIGLFRDITEQKQLNEKLESTVLERTAKLQESEQRYRMLAAISPVGIFHLDAAGTCLYANQKFSEVTGLTATQAYVNGGWEKDIHSGYASGGWEKAIHPDDLEKVREKWFASARNNQPFTMEYRFRKPDGKITWVLSHTAPIINDQQQIIGYVGTFTNITERCEAETKLRLQKLQLARHERASAMSEVATSLAHQLNQPLTVISSYAQMLQTCNACPNTHIAQKMVASAKKASDIVRNLMAFFSNGTVEKSLVNIHQLITTTVELITHSHIDAKPITFNFCKPDPILLLDKVQHEQVITNMVENSIDALTNVDHVTAKIKISTKVKDKILTVTVEDNGVGFAPHVADKLFEPFFSTKSHGTGVGLTICHSIIEAHGGKLYANSQLGQGAKFWFTLPITNQGE